jgi:hypothetical protein
MWETMKRTIFEYSYILSWGGFFVFVVTIIGYILSLRQCTRFINKQFPQEEKKLFGSIMVRRLSSLSPFFVVPVLAALPKLRSKESTLQNTYRLGIVSILSLLALLMGVILCNVFGSQEFRSAFWWG